MYNCKCIHLFSLAEIVRPRPHPHFIHIERQKISQNIIRNIREIVDMYLNTFFFLFISLNFPLQKTIYPYVAIFPISKP